MRQRILALLCLLIASGWFPGAFAVSAQAESAPVMTPYNVLNLLEPGALTRLRLPGAGDDVLEYAFTPGANGEYAVYLFPTSGDFSARVELYQGDALIADGAGRLRVLGTRLNADTEYTLRLYGTGSALMEVTRNALSRCFDQPLELTDSGYSKLIARSGDVHWYSMPAADALVFAIPETADVQLRMQIFDESGLLLTTAASVSGACAASAESGDGTLLIRVSAADGATGKYHLSRFAAETAPEALFFPESELTLQGHTEARLVVTDGSGETPPAAYVSSDPAVVSVGPDGTLRTRGAGTAVVTAVAYGGATAECAVTVEHVPVEGVEFELAELTLQVGEGHSLGLSLAPANASDRRLTFVTESDRVVTVDERGTLRAVGVGTARVVVITQNGSRTDVVFVTVEPAPKRYRALLIGQQNYASTVDVVRPGSVRSVESIAALLKTASFGDETFTVSTLMDAPRDDVIAGIRAAFADAGENDLSLVYITCHGFYQAGMTFFVMADGSVLSASDLERELRSLPGEVVLLADCCGSGGLLGEAGSPEEILSGVTSVFQGTVGSPSVHGSKVRVIASALLDQDSYRISLTGQEQDMATVFARALCDAAGWSIDRNARSSMNADTDYNGEITFGELAAYVSRRVQWYLLLAGSYEQTVCAYPEGSSFVVFARPAA